MFFLSLARFISTGFNVETVEYKNISFTVWDVGGQVSDRSSDYASTTSSASSPRIRFVLCGDITFKILKVERRIQAKEEMLMTMMNALGLIFVVDSNDRERVGEAREELQRMLSEDELRDAILLIFANKQVNARKELGRSLFLSTRIYPMR